MKHKTHSKTNEGGEHPAKAHGEEGQMGAGRSQQGLRVEKALDTGGQGIQEIQNSVLCSAGIIGSTPTEKETVAVLGMANRGPMQR